jgi:hypothetical protein
MRVVVGLLLSAVAAQLFAQSEVEFVGRYWIPQVTGRLRVEQGGFGTDIDLKRDLGFPDNRFPQGTFTWRKGRSKLTFRYTPMDYTGDQNVVRTIVFRGRQYTAGTRVVSDLEIQHMQLAWAIQFVNVRNGAFRLGPVIEADGFLMRGKLASPALNITEQEKVSAGLPTVGLAMDIRAHKAVDIYSEAAGLKVGKYGYFITSDSGIKVRAWHVLLTAGYRTFNLHVKSAPDFARVVVNGPFVGAGFTF